MDGDGARDLSAAPVQHRPRRPTPTSADTDRTPSLHFGFSCVKKGRREEAILQNKKEPPCTDQAVSWNGSSVVFRFPRATGKVRPALRSIKSCGFPIDHSNCSFLIVTMSLARCGRLARLSLGSVRTTAISSRAVAPRSAPLVRGVSSFNRDAQHKV